MDREAGNESSTTSSSFTNPWNLLDPKTLHDPEPSDSGDEGDRMDETAFREWMYADYDYSMVAGYLREEHWIEPRSDDYDDVVEQLIELEYPNKAIGWDEGEEDEAKRKADPNETSGGPSTKMRRTC